MTPFMLKDVKGCEGKHLVACVIYANGHKRITLPKKKDVNITKCNWIIYSQIPHHSKEWELHCNLLDLFDLELFEMSSSSLSSPFSPSPSSSCSSFFSVATLALGSRPRQRGCKGAGQREVGSHIRDSRECKRV